MRIYCDIDDVLSETAVSLCELAERMFGKRVAYADVRDFNLQRTFELTDEEMRRYMEAAHAPEHLTAYAPTPGAVAALRQLKAAGHEVEIVTGRPSTAWRGTQAWLEKVGLGDFAVTYVDKYGRPCPPDSNAPRMVPLAELLARHYDVAIDDSPIALKSLEVWHTTCVFVFDRPWNAAYRPAANMTRVKDWADILAHRLISGAACPVLYGCGKFLI